MHMGYAPPPLQNTEEQSLFLVAVPQPQKGHFCDPASVRNCPLEFWKKVHFGGSFAKNRWTMTFSNGDFLQNSTLLSLVDKVH